jgi:hypothetical protein
MINLLYHSHTAVPGHLEEILKLGVLDRGEQVLIALDGVLQDQHGQRLSGPTLHDYCLLTSLRVLLWARDYGQHKCFAFPLNELSLVEGAGIDPLHAYLRLEFSAPGQEDQSFILTLLPQCDLPAALTLLQLASGAARDLIDQGYHPYEAGQEVATLLAEQIYGTVEGQSQDGRPYRWPDQGTDHPGVTMPGDPLFQNDPANLPPEQIYTAGRLARSAWDTVRRGLRETERPFESANLREIADTVRAINELVNTVVGNPAARELAMNFINSQRGGGNGNPAAARNPNPVQEPAEPQEHTPNAQPDTAPEPPSYREIPLRRRDDDNSAHVKPVPPVAKPGNMTIGDRYEIPLRRRVAASGSGDANGGNRTSYQEGPASASSEGRTS